MQWNQEIISYLSLALGTQSGDPPVEDLVILGDESVQLVHIQMAYKLWMRMTVKEDDLPTNKIAIIKKIRTEDR